MKRVLAALVLVILVSGCTSVTGDAALKDIHREIHAAPNVNESASTNETPSVNETPPNPLPSLPEPGNISQEPPAEAEPENQTCSEDWACEDWGLCTGGLIKRECMDLNSCGTDEEKPVTSAECDTPPQENPEEHEEVQQPDDPEEPDEPEAAKIVLSEIFYDTPGKDSAEEWVKLLNPGGAPADISGFTLEDNAGSWTVPNGTVIPAGGSLVIARSSSGFYNMTGCMPGLEGLTLSLSNSGDAVKLKSPGLELDRAAWEGFEPGWDISASTGKSIRRKPEKYSPGPDSWLSEQEPEPC